jgi:phage tail tape-measure protein
MSDRQDLIEKAKKQLDEFNLQLDEVEGKMKDLSGEAKKIYDEQAVELRKLLKDAQKNIEKAKNTSEETWEEIKGHLDLTRKALKNSFNYFLSHYKKK